MKKQERIVSADYCELQCTRLILPQSYPKTVEFQFPLTVSQAFLFTAPFYLQVSCLHNLQLKGTVFEKKKSQGTVLHSAHVILHFKNH